MTKIYNGFADLVGNTPLVKLNNISSEFGNKANIYGKYEALNPAGSVKDRVAKQMIDDARKDGKINQDTVLIEPTSGNTGIGLTAYAASLGLRIIITMPDSMSIERRKTLAALGAELVLTPGANGMKGAIAKANELAQEINNSFIPGQFINPNNPKAHYLTTGPEIYDALDGKVDVLIAGIGTGGTISGTGKYLKEKNPNVKVIGIEPETSPVLTAGKAGPHKIQGIGAGFIPDTLDENVYDEILTISNEAAFENGKLVAKKEGLLVGISSGAAIAGAKEVSQRPEFAGKNIVVILPDTGDRYLSTALFD